MSEWLKGICSPAAEVREEWQWMTSPYQLTRQGLPGCFATTGKRLVWIAGENHYPEMAAVVAARISGIVDDPHLALVGRSSADALRAWVGPPLPAAVPETCPECESKQKIGCPKCRGMGEHPCPHCEQDMECEECDGTGEINCPDCKDGKVIPDPRVGVVAGEAIDRLLLLPVVEHIGGECDVLKAKDSLVAFRGVGWEIYLAPAAEFLARESKTAREELPLTKRDE